MTARRPARAPAQPGEGAAFTAALLVVSIVLLASTFGLGASSATVPRTVGVTLVALLGDRLIRELVARRRRVRTTAAAQPDPASGELSAILWLLALPALATALGFVVGPALYTVAWAHYRAGERPVVAAAAGLTTAAAILILFTWLLGATLPAGLFALI